MSYEFFIIKRYLKSKSKSKFVSIITVISICGVLIGVAALTFVLSMMNGFEKEVRSRIIGTTAHINILSVDGEGIEDYASIIPSLKQNKHVLEVAPFIYSKAAIASQKSSDGIVVRGIIPQEETLVTNIKETITAGSLDLEKKEELLGIALGTSLADRLGVVIGDVVIIFSLKEGPFGSEWTAPLATKFKVRALFETGMYEYDASLAYISLESAQKLFNLGEKVTGLQVKIDDFYKAGKIAEEISKNLSYRFYATDWMHMHKNLFSWMALEKYAMFIVLSLIVAVAAFNIISTLIMVVIEKRKEIGILKSIGATSTSIMKIFMFEGLVVGIIGTILGGALGFILCWVQKSFKIISLPAEIYFINTLPIDMRFFDFALVSVSAILITFLATLYPARRASQLTPVEAIRYE